MAIHRISGDQASCLHVATTAEISFHMRLSGFCPFLNRDRHIFTFHMIA
jgi:hypothetical protein